MQPCSMPTGQPTLGRLNSAVRCLNNRPHYTGTPPVVERITAAVDVMWGTDMTETVTLAEGRARVFVAVDHCSGECVGSHAARSGNRFEALEPVRQGVLRHFGALDRGVAKGLMLRHDHGSNYLARDFQAEIRFLGIEGSPAFVREPEGTAAPSASSGR